MATQAADFAAVARSTSSCARCRREGALEDTWLELYEAIED
jgi:hypothetical protein